MNCEAVNCDSPNLFRCTEESSDSEKKCIPTIFVCDGHWDCSEGTDEANCGTCHGRKS